MPLIPSNFAANSLSGTVRVSGGYANVILPVAKYAFEDREKTFVLKLRRDSAQGPVIAQSNTVTLRDFSEIISLTANTSTVAEGNLVSFTLVTANVLDGANVFFSVLPVTANITAGDFFGANTGRITINGNQGTFALSANADYSLMDETNETFRVQIRTVDTSGNVVFVSSNVAITDFYKRYNVFGVVPNNSTISQGESVTFTVSAHNVPTGTLLYYYTSGNASVTGSNIGSIVMNSVSNTITLASATGIPSGQSRILTLNIAETNLGTPLATSNPVTVAAYFIASGGTETISGGYKIHTFTTSGTFTVTSNGGGTADILIVAGGGGGGGTAGGGGGAGGLLYGSLSLPATSYPIQIGGGGGGGTPTPTASRFGVGGSNTTMGSFFALGGGGGSGNSASPFPNGRLIGGSGGGVGSFQGWNPAGTPLTPAGGTGRQGPSGGLTGYGNNGGGVPGTPGTYPGPASGAGGGAGGVGGGAAANVLGGAGLLYTISGSSVFYANGGGGAMTGGNVFYRNGLENRGEGGAGGGTPTGVGLTGGSGIVIIRYPV